jgi:hypothetical protein
MRSAFRAFLGCKSLTTRYNALQGLSSPRREDVTQPNDMKKGVWFTRVPPKPYLKVERLADMVQGEMAVMRD